MRFSELVSVIKEDFANYKRVENRGFIVGLLFSPGFKYIFFMRLCTYFRHKKPAVLFLPIFLVLVFIYRHNSFKYGIEVPFKAKIGPGFYIGHFSCITMHGEAVLGDRVRISQGVTIGYTSKGVPTIGNDVYIGAGAKIIGNVHVGNNVEIGANSVVTKDIPDNSVVVGVPGRVIRTKAFAVNSLTNA
ncbi:serine O-acetyltransferase [Paenibacillus silvisoli]|uniref:serine O-acetyltransferase n=1 Tax=Paenibacillus silvisoli TaxID=3110539 RepID=UPI0028046CD3|nr:serine O-acetyltransferase [Paenibacillus silvisoli]